MYRTYRELLGHLLEDFAQRRVPIIMNRQYRRAARFETVYTISTMPHRPADILRERIDYHRDGPATIDELTDGAWYLIDEFYETVNCRLLRRFL